MRFFVFRLRWTGVVVACGVFIATIFLLSAVGNKIVAVTSTPRKLPVYSVEMAEKKVSLGFNCAWDNADIPTLISILEEQEVKATFFVSGSWCKKYPESVRALYDAGHEIGSHSNTHADLTKLGQEEILQEIRMCNDKITAITGQAPRLFRMPSGAYNDLVIETIESEGMIPIQWDCNSVDYENPTPGQMRERIMAKLRPGSITLFHSGAKNTPAALPEILTGIKGQGYEIVTVSELVYDPPYTLDHEGRQRPA